MKRVRTKSVTRTAKRRANLHRQLRLAASQHLCLGCKIHGPLRGATKVGEPWHLAAARTLCSGPKTRIAVKGTTRVGVPWRLAPALISLYEEINALAPCRSSATDGSIGDDDHQKRTSDHNPWVMDGGTGVVRAIDITHDPVNGCDAGKIAEALRLNRDSRIAYVIWNRRIMNSKVAPWTWRPYKGENPHTAHFHISVSESKGLYDDTQSWGLSPA